MSCLRLVATLAAVLLSPLLIAQPRLYHVATDTGNLYLLGGTEVPDDSWLQRNVEDALASSATLWVEIPPADPGAGVPPLRDEVLPVAGGALHPVADEEGHGNLTFRDYFDVAMGERSVIESQRLNLQGSNYRAMQPWLAAYSFQYAFWDQQALDLVNPEDLLVARARADGKAVKSLFADRAEYYRFMGRMSDFAETHLFQAMYNTFDWQRTGEYASRYEWINGNPDAQWIEKIRTQTPDHYRYMYQRRNVAIAEQLRTILAEGGTHFLYVDVNRLLGPDSLLVAMGDLGLVVEEL